MSVEVYNMHNRFKLYWKEYEHQDIFAVCKAICQSNNVSTKNSIHWVKNNWGRVCNFLIQWEGYKLK